MYGCGFADPRSHGVSLKLSSDACTGRGLQHYVLYKFLFLFGYILYQFFGLFLAQKYIYGRRCILWIGLKQIAENRWYLSMLFGVYAGLIFSHSQACQLPRADLVLQVLVSEISIRSHPNPPAPKKTPYKLASVLQRMTFTGLVSALCSVMPGHRFPKEMSNELEELRQSVKEWWTYWWPVMKVIDKSLTYSEYTWYCFVYTCQLVVWIAFQLVLDMSAESCRRASGPILCRWLSSVCVFPEQAGSQGTGSAVHDAIDMLTMFKAVPKIAVDHGDAKCWSSKYGQRGGLLNSPASHMN